MSTPGLNPMERAKAGLSPAMGLSLAASLALWGCGGGGPGSTTNPGGGGIPAGGPEQTVQLGRLSVRFVSNSPATPVTAGGNGPLFTGLAGGQVTSLILSPFPSLAQTKIAFYRNAQVYLMNPDGSAQSELTNSFAAPSTAVSPTWAPDGTKIAFARSEAGFFQIELVNADGSNLHRISDGTTTDTYPAWSPDGTKIAFTRYESAIGHSQNWLMNTDGTNPHRIDDATTDDYRPNWSPDGTQLVFQRYVTALGHYQIYISNADGTNPHAATTILQSYDVIPTAWSPDGTGILFYWKNGANYHIYVLKSDGSNWQTITSAAMDDFYATWSPDGTMIAFKRHDTTINPAHDQIYVCRADGSNTHRISDTTSDDDTPAWMPFPGTRTLVGTGGVLGTSAAGFLFGQNGDSITSILAFNGPTPSDVTLNTQNGSTNPGLNNVAFTISGSLNALGYLNGVTSQPTTVIPNGSLTGASGATVIFNANTGKVSLVLPFTTSRAVHPTSVREGDTLVLRGAYRGVWDNSGRNRAPAGAAEVRVNARTGDLESFR